MLLCSVIAVPRRSAGGRLAHGAMGRRGPPAVRGNGNEAGVKQCMVGELRDGEVKRLVMVNLVMSSG